MPARVRKIRHDDETRAKIQTAQIINRLQAHINGEIELSATQVSAAKVLLGKTLPDLGAVEHTGTVEQTYIARLPAPVADMDEWQKRYTPPTAIQ